MSKHYKVFTIGMMILLGVVGVGTYFGMRASTVALPGTTGFSVEARDGPRDLKLPSASFNWTLWGVEGSNLNDFGQYTELATGDSLADIKASDLDTSYTQWVVKAEGVVKAADWNTDDAPVIKAIDEKYDHAYYARFFVIDSSTLNTFVFYETPSSGSFQIMNDQSFQVINMAGGVVAQTNATLIAAMNASQPYAKYVTGANYKDETQDSPYWLVTFNDTVALNYVSISGTTKTRVDDMNIKFTFDILGSVPSVFNLVWGKDAPKTVQIDTIKLSWDSIIIQTRT